MAQRIQQLREGDLDQVIAQMSDEVRDIKNQQYIGGDSIRFYQSDSGDTYDWSGTLPQSPQAAYVGTKLLVVTATAPSQPVLFADLIMELYIDSMANRYTVRDFIEDIAGFGNYFQIYKFDYPVLKTELNKQRWGVAISGGDGAGVTKPTNTCFAKFYVVGNDDVTIDVTQLN